MMDTMDVVDRVDGRRGKTGPKSTESIKSTKSTYAEISANGALALVAVACSLLDRQIASLEKNFVEEGGFTERLYRVRGPTAKPWLNCRSRRGNAVVAAGLFVRDGSLK